MSLKVVVFWGETCAISKQQVPVLVEAARQLRALGRPVTFEGVNATRNPVLNGLWDVTATPTVFITGPDPSGVDRIYARLAGVVPMGEFLRVVASLDGPWAGKPVPRIPRGAVPAYSQ